jgi:hypothetical protein
MSSRFLIAILVAGAFALACGPLARSNDAPQREADAAEPLMASTDTTAGPLATSVNVSVKDQVTLGLHVTNRSDRRLELSFRSGQTHDFVVLDSIGREVWRWSQGRMFTQAMQNRLVGSRETLSWEEKWDAAGRSGTYTAVAVLTSSTHPVEERVSFTLD